MVSACFTFKGLTRQLIQLGFFFCSEACWLRGLATSGDEGGGPGGHDQQRPDPEDGVAQRDLRRQQHELAVAADEEALDVAVAATIGHLLADDLPKVVGERS